MEAKTNVSIEQLVAKIDNDFNLDNSDWIPRVAAWTIDALNQLDCLKTIPKRRTLYSNNTFFPFPCPINGKVKVFDKNGCEIEEAGKRCCSHNTFPTGLLSKAKEDNPNDIDDNHLHPLNDHAERQEAYTMKHSLTNAPKDLNYVITKTGIEVNAPVGEIQIETNEIETLYSEYYDMELPVIPNVGILIEALGFYCLYKILSRGYKHPVFNLSASQYGTNPYYTWMQLKDKARVAVINRNIDESALDKQWQSFLYNATFYKQ